MNRIIMFSAALCSLLLILPLAAHADVVTIDRDWAFIDNRSVVISLELQA